MNLAATIANMEAAGMTPDAIVMALKCLVLDKTVDEQAERRRAADRERKRLRNSAESAEVPSPLVPPLSPAPLSPPIIPPTLNSPPRKLREINGFEIFWKIYPRKTGKGAARRAYDVAWKKTSEEIIFDAAERYAASKPDPKFTPHPATWLNQERWLDEELQPKPPPEPFKGTSNGQVFVKQGTDAFDAWSRWWRKTKGVSAPTNQDGGWFFPSEYPQEQAA